ncbi:serine--tRNA ligase [Candidatus Gottesmanbacteria bacterium RIFCSPHIGHO2_01_FULL_39_10]|uniref:Serine--tRNA ligase n=1 Tax=Candidatus Gottesmanbacteria bacterium RIFCSPHIGHO2_01_FULL_39_10 TaxID=1798375 RepID=A0A1F5ZS29_9BACT|nr:MAG: serine--tRNA ligase [Candidatus Gottesmanbacteria bacterium RIFCSPHIGHO2_01_FULL_39_10]
MITLKFLKNNKEEAIEILKKRNVDIDVEKILELDTKRSELIQKIDTLRAERNKVAKINNPESHQKGKEIKENLKKLEPELDTISHELKILLWELPNTLDPHTPEGIDEKDYVTLKKFGTPPKFDFTPLDHVDLGKKLDIIDFEKGAKVAGSQFYFLKNDAVLLEQALINFAFDILQKEKFSIIETPDLSKLSVLDGIGFQPRGPESQIYKIEGEDLGLIATAEITIGGYHQNEILDAKNLPLKYAGISHCFRREAGGYGRYSRGLYRVHQFTKVEMFIYCLPEDSPKMHDYILSIEEKIYQALEIPYRVVDVVSGDLGAPAVRKFDVEGWMPGRNDYGEITSTSNCTDYQAARLNIKYKTKDGKSEYIHMLNGTAIALARALIVILENYQQKDGSIRVPKVLQAFLGGRTKIGQT